MAFNYFRLTLKCLLICAMNKACTSYVNYTLLKHSKKDNNKKKVSNSYNSLSKGKHFRGYAANS